MGLFSCSCPKCQNSLQCEEIEIGETISCPLCGENFIVEKPTPASSAKTTKRIVTITPRTPSRQIPPPYTSYAKGSGDGKSVFDPSGVEFKLPVFSLLIYVAIGIQLVVMVLVLFSFAINLIELNLLITLLTSILIMMLFQFGIAQLINFVAKICYNSNYMIQLLQQINAKTQK